MCVCGGYVCMCVCVCVCVGMEACIDLLRQSLSLVLAGFQPSFFSLLPPIRSSSVYAMYYKDTIIIAILTLILSMEVWTS